ncbi:hypothetical protein [Streptomyces noursei]|uniref:hypothetical protein n=1 Tax=Streptomyces noursei TaxID=1971 RepID=UPI0038161589
MAIAEVRRPAGAQVVQHPMYTSLPVPELPGHGLLLPTPAARSDTESRLTALLDVREPDAV